MTETKTVRRHTGAKASTTREDRDFDQTSLNPEKMEAVHRDYIAHVHRWGFSSKWTTNKRVLDVGCGPTAPFCGVLFNHGSPAVPELYVGVDLNKIKRNEGSRKHFKSEFNFLERHQELVSEFGLFDVVTNFEVLEHMALEDALALCETVTHLLKPDGRFIMSTPVFNGKQARNHIYEQTIEETTALLGSAGFEVVSRFGTFMNRNTFQKVATDAHRAVMQELARYYDGHVLATIFAPLYPDHARNNLWVCKPK